MLALEHLLLVGWQIGEVRSLGGTSTSTGSCHI